MAPKPPIRVPASDPNAADPATFVFLHGFDDDGSGWTNIAQQFQSASKLPHLTWVFPNAPHNHEAMTTAWFTPVSLESQKIADAEKKSEEIERYEKEIAESTETICGLIDDEVKKGVKVERIVVGGFSQGAAISLVVGLKSRYRGQLGGVVGLSGFLPSVTLPTSGVDSNTDSVEASKSQTRVFLAHGTRDMLVSLKVFREAKEGVEALAGESQVESHEYDGLGHTTSGVELRHLCEFLEKVVP